MFPAPSDCLPPCGGLPRIRGGVSGRQSFIHASPLSSPHTRGCFRRRAPRAPVLGVFPAYAGVFLRKMLYQAEILRLPRIRGGVSSAEVWLYLYMQSSPHTRGCFSFRLCALSSDNVFPAYAGVFLFSRSAPRLICCLPRIRGGVSRAFTRFQSLKRSSPHTRGCFVASFCDMLNTAVFPAYAGVFLPLADTSAPGSSLPRIRGGVSLQDGGHILVILSSPHTRGCFRIRGSV